MKVLYIGMTIKSRKNPKKCKFKDRFRQIT